MTNDVYRDGLGWLNEVFVEGLGWVWVRENADRLEFELTVAAALRHRNPAMDEFSARRFARQSHANSRPALTSERREYLRQMHAALGTVPAQ